ncbi:YtpR family tRNA-binding protein [Streptococcus marimammalium]|uniref:YtpR family tRNA-binding protein n=1 Tax=Streptococcus marimammalium TaxID=269666 RepID=UPI00035CD7E9|nr:DUF4479 and tRNA-binding domain-containing protein [Streptococcus marimammalium]
MIFTYNKNHVGDVLMVIVGNDNGKSVAVERKGRVARVFLQDTKKTVAWNIFDASEVIAIEGNGQITLSDVELAAFNQEIAKAGFSESLENPQEPSFVVGEIVAMEAHPDSDHLNICQVKVAADKEIQIVAGAPNARTGLKTIVALDGAMMPNGSLIFSGKLRGEDSFGMMCSPRELALPNAPQKRGIIELDDSAIIGEAFDIKKHWQ